MITTSVRDTLLLNGEPPTFHDAGRGLSTFLRDVAAEVPQRLARGMRR
jgi:hypothetical protein